jgi:hypothetical protein
VAGPIVASNYIAFNMRQAFTGGQPYGTLQFHADMLVHFDGVRF